MFLLLLKWSPIGSRVLNPKKITASFPNGTITMYVAGRKNYFTAFHEKSSAAVFNTWIEQTTLFLIKGIKQGLKP